MPTLRPHLLTIGAQRLRTRRVRPRHTPTLLAGYDLAVRLLDRAQPVHPTLILLDLHAEEPGVPELATPQLAAVLAHQMHQGALHPAWLVGLAARLAPELDAEAYLAGCHLVLHGPLDEGRVAALQRLAGHPAPLPPTDRATEAYQRAAARVLQAVQAAQIPIWTAEDVSLLLAYLTRYPGPCTPRDQAGAKRVLRALGGLDAASARLHTLVVAWRTRHPLYAEVLWLFLDGWERREIVSYFVSRHLYEDSRISHCIKTLPEWIARELRIAQIREGR
jgi:hypothetical protein